MNTGAFAIGIPVRGNKDTSQKFADDRKWRDLWAAVIFIIHLVIVGAVCSFFGIFSLTHVHSSDASPYNSRRWVPQLGGVILLAGLFSILWLTLVKYFPIAMIKVALWAGVVVCLALGALALISRRGSSTGIVYGCVFVVFAFVQALYAFLIRKRIPFAAAMIRKVIWVTVRFPAVYVVSYLAVLTSLLWTCLWAFGAAGIVSKSKGSAVGFVFLLLLSLAWTMEVIKNTVHVTVAGTVATFYFQQHNMPPNPTANALRRACTTSFGSICLGSLLVAVLEAIRMLIQSLSENCNEFLVSCILCLLGFIDGLVQYFNRWAYVQVAVYGKNFVRAAKDTWNLFIANGCDVLINDDLTGTVLFIGCVIGGALCATLGGAWTYFHFTKSDRNMTINIATLSFFVGYFVTHLSTVVVHSAVAAYYVCFAESPAVLRQSDPDFYDVLWARQRELQG